MFTVEAKGPPLLPGTMPDVPAAGSHAGTRGESMPWPGRHPVGAGPYLVNRGRVRCQPSPAWAGPLAGPSMGLRRSWNS